MQGCGFPVGRPFFNNKAPGLSRFCRQHGFAANAYITQQFPNKQTAECVLGTSTVSYIFVKSWLAIDSFGTVLCIGRVIYKYFREQDASVTPLF